MQRRALAKVAHAVMPFVLLATLFLGGLYYVLLTTMSRVVSEDAEFGAIQLANYFSAHPADVQRAIAGRPLSAPGQAFLSLSRAGQRIVGFRLSDLSGKPASSLIVIAGEGQEPSSDQAYLADQASTAYVRAPDGESLRLTAFSNQTDREAVFHQELMRAFMCLCFLAACSFGVPAFVFLRELAQRERGEEKMEYMAQHDAMTTLMNRTAFNSALEVELGRREPGEVIAAHFIDLDRFKSVNDSLGHNVGDELLKSVASKLQGVLGPRDFVARFGGDEFIMAQAGIKSIGEAQARAEQIRRLIGASTAVGDHHVGTTASVGVAVSPRDGITVSELTRAADLAVYSAKAAGRDAWRMYDPQMDVALQHRKRIEKALLAAMATETFELNFQPIVQSENKKILGFEVLLRLKSETGETFTPVEFIPIAEDMGLISHIGSWVIRKACVAAKSWPEALMVAVNLSPRQFESGELCAKVASALRDSGLAPNRLELEITEGLLLTDTDRVIEQLKELKALGVSIAMDDFGTGYSSLSYLWRFPFDKLKIDRSFMGVLSEEGGNVSSILNTIVSLGRTLNLRVTAEGVETEEQAQALRQLNCDQLQGYHFGRPMPESELAIALLKNSFEEEELDFHKTKANVA